MSRLFATLAKPKVLLTLVYGCVIAAIYFGLTFFKNNGGEKNFIEDSVVKKYVDKFNADDDEIYIQYVSNKDAANFLKKNIPLFDCPDEQIKAVYYFRWWTFRKHIKKGEDTFVITEFLPKVPWSGKFNTISCPAAFHIWEGRWLADKTFVRDYLEFWCFGGGSARTYSFWLADSAYRFYQVCPDRELMKKLYPKLKENYFNWSKEKRGKFQNLFWQIDGADGMEKSFSGSLDPHGRGYRATINSYMYAELSALSKIAKIAGKQEESETFKKESDILAANINKYLWDDSARFYKVRPFDKPDFSLARELHGYTPWLFSIAPDEYGDAWLTLFDESGFKAPFGPCSLERRCPKFEISYEGHECQWNGPSWPYSTAITLAGLANYLNDSKSPKVTKNDYFNLFLTYAKSHRRVREDAKTVFWIDENLNPFNGDWISRSRLKTWEGGTWSEKKGGRERGKDYNHSSYADLIITGLVGFRPNPDDTDAFEINPLVPDNWNYFCLQNLSWRGRKVCVVYDKDGSKYRAGSGLKIYVDKKIAAQSKKIERLTIDLRKL